MFNSQVLNYLRDNCHTILDDYLTAAEKDECEIHALTEREEADLAEQLYDSSDEFKEYVEEGFKDTEDAYATSSSYRYN